MKTSEAFQRVVSSIKSEGWGQHGRTRHPFGKLCTAEWIAEVINRDGKLFSKVVKTLALAIGSEPMVMDDGSTGDRYIRTITIWNDAPGRTEGEVIAMLETCAATERAREGGHLYYTTLPLLYRIGAFA